MVPVRRTELGVLKYSSSLLDHDDDYHVGSAILTEAKIDAAKAGLCVVMVDTFGGDDTVNRARPHGLAKTPKLALFSGDGDTLSTIRMLEPGYITNVYATGNVRLAVTPMDNTNYYVGNPTSYDSSGNGLGKTYTVVVFA